MIHNELIYVKSKDSSNIEVELSWEDRQAIGSLVEQFTEFVNPDVNDSKRLFPTAYPDDAEKDAGYQALAIPELMDQKNDNIRLFQKTLMNETLTKDQAEVWMRVLNDIRLVIGTRLDISADEILEDRDDELVPLYENLSYLTSLFIQALD